MIGKEVISDFVDNLLVDRDVRGMSAHWANWMSNLAINTCLLCRNNHGTIVDISVLENKTEVRAHPYCVCVYVPMRTKKVGTISQEKDYLDSVDVSLYNGLGLPDYYVSKEVANAAGWGNGHKKLSSVLPNKMIGGDQYFNDDGRLPSAPGRIWYEADVDYIGGKRNRKRIMYSNDGLIFYTSDHYHTFYEITE